MTPRFLLDTDICSYVIKGSHPALDSRLRSLNPQQVAISAVTRAELRFGVALRPESPRLAMLVESFLQTIVTLPWDAPTADRYGTLRAMLRQAGQPIGDHDTMIAAHALTVNATLITHNLAHFARINGLSCADWA
ncbi:MAG: type II toxin-antitoxin system VapC family toxin [Candidatus Competibacter sp.]|nr:type II toxin-antitoxin system VapC family toxin [Candidatus Competibacter sp.]MDG4604805.1 type II toxin-antitoxin system VapC family toxin [Candidatus Contendobacter sp.]